jgi:uncharacterized protein
MTVISDTTCLSALARIGSLPLLRVLFGEVIIPNRVYAELQALREFEVDVTVFDRLDWLLVKSPADSPLLERLLASKKIDPGEAYAIALAVELQADWLVLDDLNARKVATDLGLNITGLGGIFLQAKSAGLVPSVKKMLDLCISKANFRLSAEVYRRLVDLAGE